MKSNFLRDIVIHTIMMKNVLLGIVVVVIGCIHPSFSQEGVKSVKAVRTMIPQIDGTFNDSEWLEGGKATGFIQLDPDEGAPATERTEVYFVYDDENLYIGIKCFDNERKMIINEMGSRDDVGMADNLLIYLDTFHDHQNAYSFGISVAGSKSDSKLYGDNEYDISWNGVWWAETDITAYGWIAEFKIPFSTIKFARKNFDTWGLNIERFIGRKNEVAYWQTVKRDDGKRVSKFGHLEGFEDIKQGINLEVLPYITNRFQKDRITSFKTQNENGISGLDVQYGITSNLTATLTVNPDFAQIEADEDLINLTRYPLYLPEKRPFFTEGASIFMTPGSYSFFNIFCSPFYSRRINEPVYGLKINGKIGKWNIGVLHSLNDNDLGIHNKINKGNLPESTKTEAFYNIFRLSKDILIKSQFGLLAMSKEYSGRYNRSFGIDWHWRLSNFYEILFEGIKSYADDRKGNNHSVFMEIVRRTDFFNFKVRYREQTPDFEGNEIGFYNYNDFREVFLWLQLAPRLENIGIRRFLHNINIWNENSWSNDFFDKSKFTGWWNYNTHLILMNYWMVSGYFYKGKEYDRFDHALYPVHSYQFVLRNNNVSNVYFQISHNQGKYRTGYSWSYSNSTRIRANDRLNIELTYNRSLAELINPVTLKKDQIKYEVFRSKFSYHFTRDLNTRLILQYSGMDNRLDAYFLLAYNFRPKSYLYIAYTECFDEASYVDKAAIERLPRFGSSNKIFQVKFSYLFLK